MPQPGVPYIIAVAQHPHMVMDSSENPHERRKVIIYNKHGRTNQQWQLYPAENGAFSIVNVANQGTLEIPNHSHGQQGTHVHVSQPNRTINEQWHIQPVGNGVAIKSAYNQMALNVSGGSMENDADVIIYPFEGRHNDIWAFFPAM